MHHDQHVTCGRATFTREVQSGMQRLYELHRRLATETDLKVALAAIVALSCDILGTTRGCMQLVSEDKEHLEMFAYQGYSDQNLFIQHFFHSLATFNLLPLLKEYQFKINIDDEDCPFSVTPLLDQEKSIPPWQVDVNNPDKILTVSGEDSTEEGIKVVVQKAGYNAEILSGSRLGES